MSDDSIGRDFMRKTSYEYQTEPSDQSQGVTQPPLETPYDPTQRPVDLPPPDELALDPVDLREIIGARTTIRNYVDATMSLPELSYLLWATQGVKQFQPPQFVKRTVPSAGSRHPFEAYLLVNAVEGLKPGVYRYLASVHKLLRLELGADLTRRIMQACLGQAQVVGATVMFLWVAVPERTTWRYGQRGYRYILLDAGHVCQNLYLASWPLGYGVCAIGAYRDEALNEILELDGETCFVAYVATVGKRRS